MKKHEKGNSFNCRLRKWRRRKTISRITEIKSYHKLLTLKNVGIYKEDLDKFKIRYTELNIKNSLEFYYLYERLVK